MSIENLAYQIQKYGIELLTPVPIVEVRKTNIISSIEHGTDVAHSPYERTSSEINGEVKSYVFGHLGGLYKSHELPENPTAEDVDFAIQVLVQLLEREYKHDNRIG